jgi:hypothetical protein
MSKTKEMVKINYYELAMLCYVISSYGHRSVYKNNDYLCKLIS